jgi:hypothetical protein
MIWRTIQVNGTLRTTLVMVAVVLGGWLGYVGSDLLASVYFVRSGFERNGWRYSTEWGGVEPPSLKAAAFAKHAMFGNSADEAVYYLQFLEAGSGERYMLHFDADQFPNTEFFWSITMYHGDLPYNLVTNPLDRWVVSDRTPGIVFGDDGSLDIWIQHAEPLEGRRSNWLPAPAGPFLLVLRTYGPGPEIRDGSYAPPPLVPVTD